MSAPVVILEARGVPAKAQTAGKGWQEVQDGYSLPVSESDNVVLFANERGLFVQTAGLGTPVNSLTTVFRGAARPTSTPVQLAGVEVKSLRAQFFPTPDTGWETVAEGVALKLGETGLELLINKNAPQRISVRQSPPRVDPFAVPSPPPLSQPIARKFCGKCGASVRSGATHCGNCGARL